ncbi:MAG: hypothetical protein CFE22_14545 [Cytophagaceae bacterium BCCC1]|nr:MAG: hypothetical protein CFE22_14545 [Cytophagaceae bacterium BCCC1]
MKFSSSIYILLLVISVGCKKGEIGEIGPMGAKGPTGDPGANNSTIGPIGDKGPTGNTGATGAKGNQGSPGVGGVGNLIITEWKKPKWRYTSNDIFIGEVDFTELTQNILDKSLIYSYNRINSNSTGLDDFPQGIITTITSKGVNFDLKNNGYSVGKAIIIHKSNSTSSPETTINNLNNLTLEVRLSIIK